MRLCTQPYTYVLNVSYECGSWWDDSLDKAFATQAQGPEYNPQKPPNPCMEVHVCNLSTGEVEIRGSWGPLASQSSPTNELQVQ